MNRKQRRAQATKDRRAAWKAHRRSQWESHRPDCICDICHAARMRQLGNRLVAEFGPDFRGLTSLCVSSDDGSGDPSTMGWRDEMGWHPYYGPARDVVHTVSVEEFDAWKDPAYLAELRERIASMPEPDPDVLCINCGRAPCCRSEDCPGGRHYERQMARFGDTIPSQATRRMDMETRAKASPTQATEPPEAQ